MTIVFSDGDTAEAKVSNYPGATTAQFEQMLTWMNLKYSGGLGKYSI